jgi:hypothetical protein
MARHDRGVERALHRWARTGLIDDSLAQVLRQEARAEHEVTTLRVGQLVTAVAGAVALFLAGVLFLSQTWPSLSEGSRTAVLGLLSVLIWVFGRLVGARERWTRIGEILQVAALYLGGFALVYSDNAWGEGTTGARIVGMISLIVPLALAPASWRGSVGLVAAHTGALFVFVALFLDRTLGLDFDTIVWALDGLLLLGMAVLWLRVRDQWNRGVHRALVAFTTGLYVGLILIFFTGAGVLDLSDATIWGLDLWWLAMVGLTMWGASMTRGDAERDVIESHMALCVVLGTFFLAFTGAEALEVPTEAWAGMAGVVAVAGLAWGLRVRNIPTLIGSTVSMIGVLWVYALDRAETKTAALAMVLTAALLFWVASRIRADVRPADGEGG